MKEQILSKVQKKCARCIANYRADVVTANEVSSSIFEVFFYGLREAEDANLPNADVLALIEDLPPDVLRAMDQFAETTLAALDFMPTILHLDSKEPFRTATRLRVISIHQKVKGCLPRGDSNT